MWDIKEGDDEVNIFIDNIIWHITEINWEGPAMFAVIILTILAVFRQWHILLLLLLTVVLGWGAEDFIVFNLETNMRVISLSFMIYCVGGGLILMFCLISFFKMAM